MITGTSELHESAFSGDVRVLKKLIEEYGEDVNLKDNVGQCPLHKAAQNGWLECVQLMLDKGANVHTTDVSGCTALHFAAANGYLEVAKYLIQTGHANMGLQTNKGHTPRYMAKVRGHTHMVAFFNDMEKTLKISGNYGDLQQIDIADRCRLREYIRSSCPR